jgi:hypothetical protein
MSTYRVAGRTMGDDDPQLALALAAIHAQKQRLVCLCSEPPAEMYVAKVNGHFIIKRMPNTGSAHSPACQSYEPPAELSGLGGVLGHAIQENVEEGTTVLKFDFSLSATPGRTAPIPTGKETDTAKTSGSKLGLRATLHYLWEEAGFVKWTPSMAGKRSWHVIRKYLLQATETKVAKGAPLSEVLYIPEPFSHERKDEITQRRLARLSKVLGSSHARAKQLMLVVGEVKEIAPSRFGHKLIVKHLPDCPLMMQEDLHSRLIRRFENELTLWNATEGSHLLFIGTFGAGPTGVLSLHEVSLMVVNGSWIPIENVYEHRLIEELIRSGRQFVKGQRYNLASNKPLASVVLADTQPRPVALYVVSSTASEEYTSELKALIEESDLASWWWSTEESSLPPLPARTGYTSSPRPNGTALMST